MLSRAVIFFASLVGTSGCIDDRDVRIPDEPEQARTESFEYWQWTAPPLDVLIVVDNSAQVAEHEERIASNLPGLGALIDQSGWVDMRIGITTADVGCGDRRAWRYDEQLTNGQFLIDWRHLDGTRTRNFDGELPPHITRLASAGHDGCGQHRPLDAIVGALDPTAGFRRDDADLAIVIIGASDDQSTLSIDDVIATIDHGSTAVHAPALFGAFPATANRLRTFADHFLDPVVTAIGADDMFASSWRFGLRRSLVGPPCLAAESFDTSEAAGIQASCAIADRVRSPEGAVIYERVLPACTGSNRPCWRFERSAESCFHAGDYTLAIDRVDFPPLDTILVGQCEIRETAAE